MTTDPLRRDGPRFEPRPGFDARRVVTHGANVEMLTRLHCNGGQSPQASPRRNRAVGIEEEAQPRIADGGP
jgi:hypothetical protein